MSLPVIENIRSKIQTTASQFPAVANVRAKVSSVIPQGGFLSKLGVGTQGGVVGKLTSGGLLAGIKGQILPSGGLLNLPAVKNIQNLPAVKNVQSRIQSFRKEAFGQTVPAQNVSPQAASVVSEEIERKPVYTGLNVQV